MKTLNERMTTFLNVKLKYTNCKRYLICTKKTYLGHIFLHMGRLLVFEYISGYKIEV